MDDDLPRWSAVVLYDIRAPSQDIEQDSARLLSSGVFRAARPLVFPPRGNAETYPQVQEHTASEQSVTWHNSAQRCQLETHVADWRVSWIHSCHSVLFSTLHLAAADPVLVL